MTETHRDTIMRLMVEVGTGCAKLQSEIMQGMTCERIQVWSSELQIRTLPRLVMALRRTTRACYGNFRAEWPL
jgi:hypothetical protein